MSAGMGTGGSTSAGADTVMGAGMGAGPGADLDARSALGAGPPVRTGRRRPTRRTLLRLRLVLLVTTVVTALASLSALQIVHIGIDGMGTMTTPAILEIAAAHKALAEADRAAIESFRSGGSRLTGFRPGEEYQNQIGIANQSLAQVAEDNAVGEAGSRTVQLVEGMLVVYTGLIGQADAQQRRDGAGLSVADLWYASGIMHGRPSGILAELDRLRTMHERALDRRLSSGWTHPLVISAAAVPVATLLTVLLIAQVFIRRRFRRHLAPPLLAATVLLASVSVAMVAVGHNSHSRLGESRAALRQAVAARQAEAQDASVRRRLVLVRLLSGTCGAAVDACGPTVERFGTASRGLVARAVRPAPVNEIIESRRVNDRMRAARIATPIPFLLAAAFLAVIAMIQWGFHPRIDEYRFQRR